MKNIFLSIFSLFFLFVAYAPGQSLFESSEGSSSYIHQGGIFSLNFSDANVRFGYAHVISSASFQWGFDLKLKSTEGFASLFKDNDFSLPEISGNILLGFSFGEGSYTFWGTQLEYKRGLYKLANIDSSGNISSFKKTYNGITVKAIYNHFGDCILGESLWGISVGYGRSNNILDLDEVEVSEVLASDLKGSVINENKPARYGEYKESNGIFINFDILVYQRWSKNIIAIGLLGRYNGFKDRYPFSPGIGIFISKQGSPKIILGGITFESVNNKFRVGVQVGYPF